MAVHTLTRHERWLLQHNIEGVICGIPTWEEVLDGCHTVTAIGNDGMAIMLFLIAGVACSPVGEDARRGGDEWLKQHGVSMARGTSTRCRLPDRATRTESMST